MQKGLGNQFRATTKSNEHAQPKRSLPDQRGRAPAATAVMLSAGQRLAAALSQAKRWARSWGCSHQAPPPLGTMA
jgi:hypothetical protein